MWGPHPWGFEWIFPVMGLLMFLGCLAMAFRFARTGRGCLGWRRDRSVADARREIDALRKEIEQLKGAR